MFANHNFKVSVLLAVVVMLQVGFPSPACAQRDLAFDSDWRFVRGDVQGADLPEFDDSAWRVLDLPHDWSIEDLPPRETNDAELDVVTGEWRFHRGDDANWKSADLDDSDWQTVMLPAAWDRHSDYTDDNVYGWYRRTIEVPEQMQGKQVTLLLGRIDDVDEVWVNGTRLGGTGSFPPNYQTAWDRERRYQVPTGVLRADGTNVIAVRVYDGSGEGGMYASGVESRRVGPFDPSESEGRDKTGYVVGGVGWYRKHFTIDTSVDRTVLRFDAVYMNSDVWINGHHLGNHPYGYTSFEYELTPYLHEPGVDNVIAVRVRNLGRNSRWYSGSGIVRHVWLTRTHKQYVPSGGLFVSTHDVQPDQATVELSVEIQNRAEQAEAAVVDMRLTDPLGQVVKATRQRVRLPAKDRQVLKQSLQVASPKLWSLDAPQLYRAEVSIEIDGETVDAVGTTFGIRSVEMNANDGLLVNGEPVLLKGGCIHHDNGPLGAAAIDRAEVRKVELLKANGYNAIRTSHAPPAPAMLAACDRLGMLVIDEAFDQWNEQKLDNDQDYHRHFKDWYARDIASMVRRDRNHPSVIMWSVGNEIPEQFRGEATQLALREAVLQHDRTRPVTQAICNDWGKVYQNWDQLSDIAFKHLDAAGYNYLPQVYERDHERVPDRVIYGAESYPKDALVYWDLVEQHPYVIGDFVWTAIDYLGESGLAHSVLSNEPNPFFMSWPWHNAWCGDLDLCGFKKPQSYYRDVLWRRSSIELAVHAPMPEGTHEVLSGWAWPNEYQKWNWAGYEQQPLQVAVYTRCSAVRLELNGQVIGEQQVAADAKLTAVFQVPYAPGTLKAIGLEDGKVIAETELVTAGEPVAVKLTADRATIKASRNDLAYVTVELVDADGNRVPDAQQMVEFSVEGVAELAAQANGAPNRPASFHAPVCETRAGRCLAILRPTGERGLAVLKATVEGLEPAEITIEIGESSADTQASR
ncbi:glycoside hydrolase family 2 TIM barrel-domain containing protein [Aeoliella mucimassa]|uniref:Beta-galactosidase n=1 Tax=Aeoliella mucimassa TaxID=2527972 RepID=A0A518AUD9_9BACT|nr:glycoside hydrolase family 2 TIM barrel-domain containing protein [Aeoliella mucimassa]QDU58340.1 Beta-galactosidase [Aeoliella mucimassa]